MSEQLVLQNVRCLHCNEETLNPIFNGEDTNHTSPFCCNGCRSVYNLLNEKGLEEYYDIRNNSADIFTSSPVKESHEKFTYLNDSEFQKDFCSTDKEGRLHASFYLEGVHCLACLWLIEKTPEFVDGVQKARLDLGKSVADFVVDKDDLSHLATELSKLGYNPHPLKKGEEVEKLKKKEERNTLLKIGIAGACAGNTMLYSVGLYAGADGLFARSFEYIALLFTLPVMFYSATPFYKGTLFSLSKKILSIDVPVAFALWVAFFASLFNLFIQNGHVYFDLINTLVFLMLLSRYFMKKASESSLSSEGLSHFFQSTKVLRLNRQTNEYEHIHAKYIKNSDIIKVLPGETFAVDGSVIEGEGHINTSVLTGESSPIRVQKDSLVYSGTINQENPLLIKVTHTGDQTRMGEILKDVEKSREKRAPIVTKVDMLTKYFVTIVLVMAFIVMTYFYFQNDFETGFVRALALIIISCPCALGLATPLAMTRSLTKAAQLGVIVKNESILERLSNLKNLIIDKTGTLTLGKFDVTSAQGLNKENASIIYALEKRSNHPMAQAICDYIQKNFTLAPIKITNYKEELGKGVSGIYEQENIEIMTLKAEDRKDSQNIVFTQIGFYREGILQTKFYLRDHLRSDATAALDKIKGLGLNTIMASGDHKDVVAHVAQELGLNEGQFFSEMTPEKKADLVSTLKSTIMVGDGANDALAISRADLGIAVKGSVSVSLRAAGAYLSRPGIMPIADLIELSSETLKLVHRNLFFSLLYNAIGALAAISGHVTPLWAAIFMPASSITVLLSTVYATTKMRKMGGEN